MSSVDQCILISGDRGIHLRLRATEQSSCNFAVDNNIIIYLYVFIIFYLYFINFYLWNVISCTMYGF